MGIPLYKMTEEVIRQSVEVIFKQDERWDIAFTNPTAGPWKRIRYGQYIGGADLRYKKEDDRPDLILFNAEAGLVIVLEAKDNIKQLIVSNIKEGRRAYPQLEKSVEVFANEFQRLDNILKNQESASLVFGGRSVPRVTVLCGYLYPQGEDKFEGSRDVLHQAHALLAKSKVDPRLLPCIDIIVSQEVSSLNLRAKAQLNFSDASLNSLLKVALPATLQLC